MAVTPLPYPTTQKLGFDAFCVNFFQFACGGKFETGESENEVVTGSVFAGLLSGRSAGNFADSFADIAGSNFAGSFPSHVLPCKMAMNPCPCWLCGNRLYGLMTRRVGWVGVLPMM